MREEFIDFDESRILWILNNGSHGLWVLIQKQLKELVISIFLYSKLWPEMYMVLKICLISSYHFR